MMLYPGSLFEGITFCLDGIECGIPKPTNQNDERAYFSSKKGTHSIKYEICTLLSSGWIMWCSGGVWGSAHDIILMKNSGGLDTIPAGEKGLVDKGHEGLDPATFLVMLKAT